MTSSTNYSLVLLLITTSSAMQYKFFLKNIAMYCLLSIASSNHWQSAQQYTQPNHVTYLVHKTSGCTVPWCITCVCERSHQSWMFFG